MLSMSKAHLFVVPMESFYIIQSSYESFSVVVSHMQRHLLLVSVVNDESVVILLIKLNMSRGEVNLVCGDVFPAVSGHEDVVVLGVGEYIVAVVFGMIEELVDGGLSLVVAEVEAGADVLIG